MDSSFKRCYCSTTYTIATNTIKHKISQIFKAWEVEYTYSRAACRLRIQVGAEFIQVHVWRVFGLDSFLINIKFKKINQLRNFTFSTSLTSSKWQDLILFMEAAFPFSFLSLFFFFLVVVFYLNYSLFTLLKPIKVFANTKIVSVLSWVLQLM